MHKWGKIVSPLCLHCNKNQTLGHVIGGCEIALREKRYNFRHDSILLNLGKILESVKSIDLYIDIPGYKNPTIITGESQRPDLLVIFESKLCVIELTAGYETNIKINSRRKESNYKALMDRLSGLYNKVQFVNLSMGALGIYGESCEDLVTMLRDLGMNKKEIDYVYANYIMCAYDVHIIYFVLETGNGVTRISFAGDYSNCLFVT